MKKKVGGENDPEVEAAAGREIGAGRRDGIDIREIRVEVEIEDGTETETDEIGVGTEFVSSKELHPT